MMPSGKTTSGTQWRVPFMRPDLPPYADVAREIEAAVASGLLTKGPHLRSLEEKVGAACGTSDAVGVSNCTSGLMLVLRAIASFPSMHVSTCACEWCPPACRSAPAAERDEVILPSFNFLAAPAAMVWAGLRPVFVDVDPRTFTVDAAAVKAAITPRTAAILACHTFGCPCDMSALTAIAGTAGVPLVVDAAHGLGSTQDGRQVGAGGLAQVFSMSPTKLVVAGEGGVVATSCGCLADALRIGREYGNDGGYDCDRAGLNARLPELSAILGRASLARLAGGCRPSAGGGGYIHRHLAAMNRGSASRPSLRGARRAGRISASPSTLCTRAWTAMPCGRRSRCAASIRGPTIRQPATACPPLADSLPLVIRCP